MKFQICIVVYSILFATRLKIGVLGSLQQITFFQGYNCQNRSGYKSEIVTNSKYNLTESWLTDASSLLIVGLWKITESERSHRGIGSTETVHYNTLPPAGRCINKINVLGEYFFTKVERLGSPDMTTSEIVFFTESSYEGDNCTVNESTMKLPNGPIQAQSYVHLSNDVWTVYPYENFTGNPVYLRPMDNFDNYKGKVISMNHYSYNRSTTITVGSVRKGDVSMIKSNVLSVVSLFVFTACITLVGV